MPKDYSRKPIGPQDFEDVFWYVPKIELTEAERNFEAYLKIVLRIFERIEADPEALAELKRLLTERREKKPGKTSDSD